MDLNEDINNVDLAQSLADADSISDVSSVLDSRHESARSHGTSNNFYENYDDWTEFGPMEDFKRKVFQLCIDIGLGMPSDMKYASDDVYLTRSVYCITFSDDSKPDYILKIGASPWERTEGNNAEVAVLLYLQRFEFLCSPAVVAWDNEDDNVIQTPYIMMEKLPGQRLYDFYYELDTKEKIEVALAIAEYMSKLETVTFDRAGALRARDSETQCLPWSSPFSPRFTSPFEIEVGPFRKEEFGEYLDVLPVKEEPLHSLLLRILNHRILLPQEDGVPRQHEDVRLESYRVLKYIVGREFARGNFKKIDAKCFLSHYQLTAQDFLMTKSKDGWKITGVLGWREAMSLPGVLARNPCEFLTADKSTKNASPLEWKDKRRNTNWHHVRRFHAWRVVSEFSDKEIEVRTRFFTEMRKRCHDWLNDVVYRNDVRRLAFWVLCGRGGSFAEYAPKENFMNGYLYEYKNACLPAGGPYGSDGPPPGLSIVNDPWDFTMTFLSYRGL